MSYTLVIGLVNLSKVIYRFGFSVPAFFHWRSVPHLFVYLRIYRICIVWVSCAQKNFFILIWNYIYLQKVLSEYHGEVPVNENLGMKIYLATLMALQLSEFACYLILYSHISNHNKAMLKTSIINNDIYLVNIYLKPIKCGWLK